MIDVDLAPEPPERLEIARCEATGWIIRHDGHIVAAFTSIRDLTRWLDDTLGPLEAPTHTSEPLPQVFDDDVTTPRRRSLWQVIAGGRS